MIQKGERSKWLSFNNHNIKYFTEGEISKITSNYGAFIGKGGFGEVYRGVLEDGSIVAVKRLVRPLEDGRTVVEAFSKMKEDFAKELKVHSESNHKNVVRLIGYCAEENALMIVTEYISKGNLSHVLHHDCIPIPLDTRLRIAVECSEALYYMHSYMYNLVIHGDIKPANILLDDNFNAKISDFGISRLVNRDVTLYTEHVRGSRGYMDPLFHRYGRLTSKSDVYSFGILLLELITRKKASIKNGEIGIVECFTQAPGIRRVRELFDVEISSQNNMMVLEGVAKLAGECLRMEMDRRPEMIEVAVRLQALRKTQVQGKQTTGIFAWEWWNKPAAQNNRQSSGTSGVHVPQNLPCNLCRHFSLTEVRSATRNFDVSQLVGVGRSGKFYYGLIDGGATKVAIKRGRDVEDVRFQEEIEPLAKLRHNNLVSLVGYYREDNEMVLIYDYIACGTLRGKLYGRNTDESPLSWTQRLEVCIGAARALHYLYECSIIYWDLKTTDILLDKSLVAKVLLPRVLSPQHDTMSMDIMGTCGYLDREFITTMQVTEKSDVYSFGIMLFEVLCARTVLDPTLPSRQVDLVECALKCKEKGILDLIVDPHLQGKIAPWCLNKFVETAEKCVAEHGVDRPSMREVLQNLEMCLAEESRGLGDETLNDAGTNRHSTGERRLNLGLLDMYLSDESGRKGCELSVSDYDGDAQVYAGSTDPNSSTNGSCQRTVTDYK